jgi:alpha-mannosidase
MTSRQMRRVNRSPTHQSRLSDANQFEVCNQKWTALCEEKYGFAILNDCKYGVSVFGNSINLTLLKSALPVGVSGIKLDFRLFEIKTVRLALARG